MASIIGSLPFPAVAGSKAADKARVRARVDHKTSPEAMLVRRVQAGDEMAFREIVERYQSKIFSIIYGILRNHNDAEGREYDVEGAHLDRQSTPPPRFRA